MTKVKNYINFSSTKLGMKRMKEGYYYLVQVALTPAKTGNTVKQ